MSHIWLPTPDCKLHDLRIKEMLYKSIVIHHTLSPKDSNRLSPYNQRTKQYAWMLNLLYISQQDSLTPRSILASRCDQFSLHSSRLCSDASSSQSSSNQTSIKKLHLTVESLKTCLPPKKGMVQARNPVKQTYRLLYTRRVGRPLGMRCFTMEHSIISSTGIVYTCNRTQQQVCALPHCAQNHAACCLHYCTSHIAILD